MSLRIVAREERQCRMPVPFRFAGHVDDVLSVRVSLLTPLLLIALLNA